MALDGEKRYNVSGRNELVSSMQEVLQWHGIKKFTLLDMFCMPLFLLIVYSVAVYVRKYVWANGLFFGF